MADSASTSRRHTRRWLLITSLMLNLFLIGGIAAGLVARHGPGFFGHERPHRLVGMPSPHKIRAVLPEEARPMVDRVFDAHRADMHARLGRLMEARQEVAAAIRAEPFDAAVLDRALAALRAREGEVASGAQSALVELMAGLDAESRASLAELVDLRRRASTPPQED